MGLGDNQRSRNYHRGDTDAFAECLYLSVCHIITQAFVRVNEMKAELDGRWALHGVGGSIASPLMYSMYLSPTITRNKLE